MEKIWLTPEESEDETDDESPPVVGHPHVMTEPSSLIAAKDHMLEKMWLTPEESEDETDDESPPVVGHPHVMTEPSSFSAAKEY